jgi:hypothetical protein
MAGCGAIGQLLMVKISKNSMLWKEIDKIF